MLQKVLCDYVTPISKFKSNPSAVLSEANGDAIAVSAHNEIQFYAIPARRYEQIIKLLDARQKAHERPSVPGKFTLTEEMVEGMINILRTRSAEELMEFVGGDDDED